ncbi:MAG: hypothetical protein H0W16_06400, partial [Actinobacteria bacterium]|nr:hypothetical protein [Actinomycetota bacterium]
MSRARTLERALLTSWPTLLVAAACTGIAGSQWVRPPAEILAVVIGLSLGAAILLVRAARLGFAAVALVGLGLWWGGLRGEALEQSVLAARIGESASARVVVTGPVRRTPFAIRVPAEVVRFGTTRFRERVLLELPPERAPPQGAVLE